MPYRTGIKQKATAKIYCDLLLRNTDNILYYQLLTGSPRRTLFELFKIEKNEKKFVNESVSVFSIIIIYQLVKREEPSLKF
jgi:hypothetical protein